MSRQVFASYVGIGPFGSDKRGNDGQYFGSIVVEYDGPSLETAYGFRMFAEWLVGFGLPDNGRSAYSQLAILSWKEFEG